MKRTLPLILTLIAGILLLLIINLLIGSVKIPVADVCRILMGDDSNEIWTNIIFSSRLPQALTAIMAGAGLAVSGLQMQTVFRNPLAGPSVLGISNGSALGVHRCHGRAAADTLAVAEGKGECHLIDYRCDDWLSGQCDHRCLEIPCS